MYLQLHHFSHCLLLSVLLGLAVDVTSGMIQMIPQYPVIGGSVTLSLTGVTETLEYIAWYKAPKPDSKYIILTYLPGDKSPLVTGDLYNPRFSAFSNGSLQIKDLHITDGGDYTVKIQTVKSSQDIKVTLTVYEPVTKPNITASTTQPKENDTFTLTCNTSKATTITWTRRGTRFSSEAKLSGDNRTLTFSSVKREDSGEYQCEAQNPVSKDSSDPYTVTVAYGPDKVRIEGALLVGLGYSTTLSCSADSFPPPKYQWKVNGTVLEENASKYYISNAKTEDEGTYTCVVTNPMTLRTVTTSVYVNVTEDSLGTSGDGDDPSTGGQAAMIIGIAVAIVLLLILIAAIIYLFIIRKRRKSPSDTNSKEKVTSRNGQADIPTQTVEQHELQYAAIEFSNNTPRKQEKPETIYENRSPQAPPPSDNVVYSELKLR